MNRVPSRISWAPVMRKQSKRLMRCLAAKKKHGTAMRKALEMAQNVGEIWLSWVVHYPNKGYTKGIEGMKEICLEALKLSELISWPVDRLMTVQCHRYPMVSPHFQTKPNPSLECVSGIQKLVHVDVGSTLNPITSEYSIVIVHQRLVFRTKNILQWTFWWQDPWRCRLFHVLP